MQALGDYDVRLAISWLIAAAILVVAAFRKSRRLAAYAFWSIPVTLIPLGFFASYEFLSDPNSVAPAISKQGLSYLWSRKMLTAGYVLTGIVILGMPKLSASFAHVVRSIRLEWKLPAIRENQSWLRGLAVVIPLAIAGLAVEWLLNGSSSLANGDESSVFRNMDTYTIVMVALAAGFQEELLYRGVIQGVASKFLGTIAGIAIQAVLFGMAHSGYGTWAHILLPLSFAIVVGIARNFIGLPGLIAVHAGVDILAFARDDASSIATIILVVVLTVSSISCLIWLVTQKLKERELNKRPGGDLNSRGL